MRGVARLYVFQSGDGVSFQWSRNVPMMFGACGGGWYPFGNLSDPKSRSKFLHKALKCLSYVTNKYGVTSELIWERPYGGRS